mmetsp:Transcript_12615/g.18395  ORF Transcript_12615/g.18395 Transcript_12615/m.18395 type:complete len:206 (+) Transcript_12615:475-1092(+)
MSVVTVGHHLNVHGTISRSAKLLDESHSLLDSEDVHTINTDTGDVVAHLVIIRMTGVTVDGSSHTVAVVLNTENHGQLPQTGHIGRFPNLSLVGGTISIACNGDIHILTRLGVVFIGKGKSGTNGNLRTDNPLSTEEVILFRVEMHGSSLPLGHTPGIPEQLSEDGGDVASPGESDAVTTIGCDPGIFAVEGGLDSGGDGFLAVV